MITKLALLLILQVRVVVLDPTLPRSWVESIVAEARALHGVPFAPIRYRRDPLGGSSMSWARKSYRLAALRSSRLHRQMSRRGERVHYLHGKTSEGYLGGLAYQGGNISIGYVGLTLASGNDASDKAVTVIAHELGHNRGASHVPSATIMNFGALGFPIQPRTWDPASLSEMK